MAKPILGGDMEVKDLTNEALLLELENENKKIASLRNKRAGLDNEIDTEYMRRTELQNEINRRFMEGL